MKYFEARNFLASVPYINSGGCLVSAYAFQQFCIKNGYKVPQIVALHYSNSDPSYLTNRAFVVGSNDGKATSASHFGWTYGTTIIDCDEILWTRWRKKVYIPIEQSTAFYKSAMVNGSWNPSFDWGDISVISRALGVDLSF